MIAISSKSEARNSNFETITNVQNKNDPNPPGCHCERSEGRYDPRRFAPRNDRIFCFACLREVLPCGTEAGVSIFEFRVFQ